jgi:hypothetical protein
MSDQYDIENGGLYALAEHDGDNIWGPNFTVGIGISCSGMAKYFVTNYPEEKVEIEISRELFQDLCRLKQTAEIRGMRERLGEALADERGQDPILWKIAELMERAE